MLFSIADRDGPTHAAVGGLTRVLGCDFVDKRSDFWYFFYLGLGKAYRRDWISTAGTVGLRAELTACCRRAALQTKTTSLDCRHV